MYDTEKVNILTSGNVLRPLYFVTYSESMQVMLRVLQKLSGGKGRDLAQSCNNTTFKQNIH